MSSQTPLNDKCLTGETDKTLRAKIIFLSWFLVMNGCSIVRRLDVCIT